MFFNGFPAKVLMAAAAIPVVIEGAELAAELAPAASEILPETWATAGLAGTALLAEAHAIKTEAVEDYNAIKRRWQKTFGSVPVPEKEASSIQHEHFHHFKIPEYLARHKPVRQRLRPYVPKDQEIKYINVACNAAVVPHALTGGVMAPTAGSDTCLNALKLGDAPTHRDGNTIMFTRIAVHGCFYSAVLTAQTHIPFAPSFYVALVLDTQCNGVAIDSDQVFAHFGLNTCLFRPLRTLGSGRFRVLDSATLPCTPLNVMTDGTNTASMNHGTLLFRLYHEVPVVTRYADTGATADIADVKDNAFYVIAFTDSPDFTSYCSYIGHLMFIDK